MKKNNSRLISRIAAAAVISATVASCNFTDAPATISAVKMQLSDFEVTMMVGDTLSLECRFQPDSVTAPKAFWYKDSPNIELENPDGVVCQVIGTQPGNAWVYAITLNDNLRDSCLVHVTESWTAFDPAHYQYDMVVIADVDIDGTHNDPKVQVGAFIGSQLRGVGEVCTVGDYTFTAFRIYSNKQKDADVTFRYKEPETNRINLLDYTVPFDGELHGMPTNPISMTNK